MALDNKDKKWLKGKFADKKWINEQFISNMKSTVQAIHETISEAEERITSKIIDRIDRLENTYALEKRVDFIEKKIGIRQKS